MRISIWISGEHYGSTICLNRQSRIVTRFVGLLLVYASTLLIDDYSVNAKRIMKALATSTKNAATNGRMINAVGAGPWVLVTAVMFAMAVGVAPIANPPNPALNTAA